MKRKKTHKYKKRINIVDDIDYNIMYVCLEEIITKHSLFSKYSDLVDKIKNVDLSYKQMTCIYKLVLKTHHLMDRYRYNGPESVEQRIYNACYNLSCISQILDNKIEFYKNITDI